MFKGKQNGRTGTEFCRKCRNEKCLLANNWRLKDNVLIIVLIH